MSVQKRPFWNIVLEIPDTVTKPFVFCWNLEFTDVKARVFCGMFELGTHQSSF